MKRQFDENNKTIRKIGDLILCTKCNIYLPIESFTESQRDGYGYCKECTKIHNKKKVGK